MSRQQRLIRLPLVGTILLCILVGVSLIAWKWVSQPDPEASTVKHPVDTSPDDALKYWTADKKRKAKASNMPHVDAPDREKKPPQRPPHKSDPRKS